MGNTHHEEKTMKKALLLAAVAASLLTAFAASAKTLVFNAGVAGPNEKAAFQAAVEDFKKANPDIEVKLSFVDLEGYKVQLPNWLQAESPDVVNWYAGERMRYYVQRGLLEDLSDLWAKSGWKEQYSSTLAPSSYQGKQYALPYKYYSWGVFFRTDVFERAGIPAPPKDWNGLLDACEKLKAAGVAPITVGGGEGWNLAGWFDYLDLRTNGYDFHIRLTEGRVPYTDPRVRKAFEHWKTLLDKKCFIENATSYNYNTAQPFLYQGKAAMFLMGTFMSGGFPAEVKDKIGYFQFPVIDPAVKPSEDGPTDTLHIPKKAKNKAEARRFLQFVGRPDNLGKMAKAMGSLPTNTQSPPPTEPLEKAAFAILSGASGGVAQFYDRDTTKEMADEGMKGMQEFFSNPGRLGDVLSKLEKTRKRIYKIH
jgi:multiple sugar transport system substrate-binding protein